MEEVVRLQNKAHYKKPKRLTLSPSFLVALQTQQNAERTDGALQIKSGLYGTFWDIE